MDTNQVKAGYKNNFVGENTFSRLVADEKYIKIHIQNQDFETYCISH